MQAQLTFLSSPLLDFWLMFVICLSFSHRFCLSHPFFLSRTPDTTFLFFMSLFLCFIYIQWTPTHPPHLHYSAWATARHTQQHASEAKCEPVAGPSRPLYGQARRERANCCALLCQTVLRRRKRAVWWKRRLCRCYLVLLHWSGVFLKTSWKTTNRASTT